MGERATNNGINSFFHLEVAKSGLAQRNKMNGNIVTTLFNGSSTLIKGACIANPPTVIPNTYGNSEEQGFISIVKKVAPQINILHKTQNPEYLVKYSKHLKDKNNWEFTDFDRTNGDWYQNGFRVDLKVASCDMVDTGKGLPSYVAGSIPVSSLYDFHQNDGFSLYLCVSKDWSRMFVVDADAAWDYAMSDSKLKKLLAMERLNVRHMLQLIIFRRVHGWKYSKF